MGKLEDEVQVGETRRKIQKASLEAIKTAGLLSVTLFAPNALKFLKIYDRGKIRKRDPKYALNSSLERLLERGFVKFETTSKGKFLRLTKKGQNRIDLIQLKSFRLKRSKRWDGKWRIVIFDIKESKRKIRDHLRVTLNNLDFLKLQNSVWISPYRCEDLITLLKADFKLGREVIYIIANKIEGDSLIKKHFGIS